MVRKYGVTSFPTTFLISPNGVVLAKNLRGDNVNQLVKEVIQPREATAVVDDEYVLASVHLVPAVEVEELNERRIEYSLSNPSFILSVNANL